MTKDIKVDAEPEAAGAGIDDGRADILESQANISIFLGILILTVFVMPSVGVGEAISSGMAILSLHRSSYPGFRLRGVAEAFSSSHHSWAQSRSVCDG